MKKKQTSEQLTISKKSCVRAMKYPSVSLLTIPSLTACPMVILLVFPVPSWASCGSKSAKGTTTTTTQRRNSSRSNADVTRGDTS